MPSGNKSLSRRIEHEETNRHSSNDDEFVVDTTNEYKSIRADSSVCSNTAMTGSCKFPKDHQLLCENVSCVPFQSMAATGCSFGVEETTVLGVGSCKLQYPASVLVTGSSI